MPASFTSNPSPSATAVVPRAVPPSIKLISAAVALTAVLPKVNLGYGHASMPLVQISFLVHAECLPSCAKHDPHGVL